MSIHHPEGARRKRPAKKRKYLIILTVIATLLVLRALLPVAARYAINKEINAQPGLSGEVAEVRIGLLSGRYSIEGLSLRHRSVTDGAGGAETKGRQIFSAREVGASIHWAALLRGVLEGDAWITRPEVTIVQNAKKEKTSEQEQDGGKGKPTEAEAGELDWQSQVRALFPIKVASFIVRDGVLHYVDRAVKPQLKFAVDKINVDAANLTNRDKLKDAKFARVHATASPLGSSKAKLDLQLDPLKKDPTFALAASVSDLDLTKVNDFLLAYGKFDVQRGDFSLFTEFVAKEGGFTGYVKPMFRNLDVLNWQEEKDKKSNLELFWKAIVGATAAVLKNKPEDQLATKIQVAGKFDDPKVNTWSAVASLLKNGFVRALIPKIENSVHWHDIAGDGSVRDDASAKKS